MADTSLSSTDEIYNHGEIRARLEAKAVGYASAFIDGHLEEGGLDTCGKTMDIVFSDESTASGLIYRIDKSMLYESGPTISVF